MAIKSLIRKMSLVLLSASMLFSQTGMVGYAASNGITLVAEPKGAKDYIHLSWQPPNENGNFTYQIYQKKPGDDEFQTIPANQTVKVLNVYPPVGASITFTNYKGQTFTLPKAASLKMWMEAPNGDHPKGYGMGLIDVDAVSIVDFNNNPYAYLKDQNGRWKYDVIFFGSWDNNGNYELNELSRDATKAFIDSGRGVLFGHDAFHGNKHDIFASLRSYVNIKLKLYDNIPEIPFVGSDDVLILRKGLLTNYPWKIGSVGTVLNIPYTHTSSQIALGDVWMEFTDIENGQNPEWRGPIVNDPVTGQGTNNFYLTTWNNTAMIQTGHSNGEATPDEQKVLANTLFYLAQITEQTSWDDHMGQDVDPPIISEMPTVSVTPDGKVTIQVSAEDQGSEYSYYVKATGEDGQIYVSDVVTVTITSGIKGYSIVIDQKPDTVPDDVIDTTSNIYQAQVGFKGPFYVHLLAIDNAGNKSDVLHFPYTGSGSPVWTYTVSDEKPTNQDVQIQVTAYSPDFGIKRIKQMDINKHGLKGVYYTHPPVPNVPPTTKNSPVFERIDPVIDFEWGESSPDPSKMSGNFFTVEWTGLIYAPVTGMYEFKTITDDGVRLDVNGIRVIDKWVQQSPTEHIGQIYLEGGKWYPIKMMYYENEGIAVAKLFWKYDGTNDFEIVPSQYLAVVDDNGWVNGDTLTFTATENGTYLFVAEDYFGNMWVFTVTVDNIDRIPPLPPSVDIGDDWVKISSPEPETIVLYRVNGGEWKEYRDGVLDGLTDGEYLIEAKTVDRAGNESYVERYVYVYKNLLKKAKSLVESAEKYPTFSGIEQAREVVLQLPDIAPEKKELLDRLNVLEYQLLLNNAEKKVKQAENFLREPYVSNAFEAVHKLPDGSDKDELLRRLNDVLRIIEERERQKTSPEQAELERKIKEATQKVELAERMKREPYISNAEEAVKALPNGEAKENLQSRLDYLKRQLEEEELNKLFTEAERKVKQAETYRREPYVSNAFDAVNALPDGERKQSLLERLHALMPKGDDDSSGKNGQYNPGDNIVEVAESILDPQARKVYLDWAKAVERAEKYFSRANIVYAINKLESVPADMIVAYQSLYDELYGRTMVMKQLYNEMVENQELEKLISKAATAVETYERFGTERYRLQAQEAVDALPDSVVKEMLQQRIDAVSNH